MGYPVNWFQITAKDGKPLQKFYKSVFAWKMREAPGGMKLVTAEKGGINGGVGGSMDGSTGVTVYVSVTDIHKHLQKVEKAGGKMAMSPEELPGNMGTIAGFLDPGGNWVGLWQAPKKRAKAKPKKKMASKKRK